VFLQPVFSEQDVLAIIRRFLAPSPPPPRDPIFKSSAPVAAAFIETHITLSARPDTSALRTRIAHQTARLAELERQLRALLAAGPRAEEERFEITSINMEDLVFHKLIGSGSFADVFEAVWTLPCAVKRLRGGGKSPEYEMSKFQRESRLLR
jgi:hypothetical protein